MIPRASPVTTLRIDTPGRDRSPRWPGSTATEPKRSHSAMCRRSLRASTIGWEVPGIGAVAYDIAFGGAYYAYVKAENLGLNWPPEQGGPFCRSRSAVESGDIRLASLDPSGRAPTLGFLYGVVLSTDRQWTQPILTETSVCFADGEIDRSADRHWSFGGTWRSEGPEALSTWAMRSPSKASSGSRFVGSAVEDVVFAGVEAVVPQISGSAHITGRATFWIDPADPLNPGFLLR